MMEEEVMGVRLYLNLRKCYRDEVLMYILKKKAEVMYYQNLKNHTSLAKISMI